MKTERYGYAFCHLREVCDRAVSEQEALLERLLRENKDTVYGRRYGFADIRGSRDYRRRVPLTEFADYDGYTERIINGEENVLTSAPAVFFNISSGSVGEQKYAPVVREDIDKHRLYDEEAIPGIVQSELAHGSPDELFGCVFNIGDVFMTSLPDGRLCEVRSGVYLQSAMAACTLDTSVYTAPPDIMFPQQITDTLYPKVRYALANGNVTAIHGVFIHCAAGLFAYIERNFEAFIYDIRHGTVGEGFRMSDDVRRSLTGRFAPDPERADCLASLAGDDLADGMLLKIWPKLRYIRCINGGQFSVYGDSAVKYVKGVPIHSYIYAASESGIGVSPGMDMPGEYVLIPDVCYTEFIPADEDGDDTDTLTIAELETGKRYEIVITTLSGLYRYRIGDVIEVTGRYGEAPIIKVCYRRGLVMNIADERMNLSQLEPAVMLFEERTGVSSLQYCFSGEMNDTSPRYVLYIEGAPAEILSRVNKQICSNNEAGMFVTVWLGILEISTGKLTAASAGHEYPMLNLNGKYELLKDKHGLAVGAMDIAKYKDYEITLKKGDSIFVYTDGVAEATNAKEELFGTERTLNALNKSPDAAPEQILKNVRVAVDEFVKEAPQFDDLTMLCLKYNGKSS